MNYWIAILGMALVTLLTRALPLLALRGDPPPWLRRWLDGVPVAVFTALALQPVLIADGRLQVGLPLAAGLVGAAVAWRTGNVFLTIGAGMIAYWVMRSIGL